MGRARFRPPAPRTFGTVDGLDTFCAVRNSSEFDGAQRRPTINRRVISCLLTANVALAGWPPDGRYSCSILAGAHAAGMTDIVEAMRPMRVSGLRMRDLA